MLDRYKREEAKDEKRYEKLNNRATHHFGDDWFDVVEEMCEDEF